MLFKMSEYIRRSKVIGIPHRGVVVDNDDPKQIGRVKASVMGLWDGLTVDQLPWVYPQYPADLGATEGHISTFMVPRVGSEVVITFPYDDIYFGYYIGHWDTGKTKAFSAFNESYPDVYGFTDPIGNQVAVNLSTKVVTFTHSSGTVLTVQADGSIVLNDVKNVQINAEKIQLDAPTDQTGVVTMECYCPFTGSPHCDGSTRVFAGK